MIKVRGRLITLTGKHARALKERSKSLGLSPRVLLTVSMYLALAETFRKHTLRCQDKANSLLRKHYGPKESSFSCK